MTAYGKKGLITAMTINPIHIAITDTISVYFFTRYGGYSEGVYDSLNIGLSTGDDSDTVYRNRAIIADYLEIPRNQLLMLSQIHSTKVVSALQAQQDVIEADGLWADQKNLALAIQTADCMPIMFADIKSNIIAACHAGWRGALDGIIKQTVLSMEQQGAKRQHIQAIIGPCIHQKSYEVDNHFYHSFIQKDHHFQQFFIPSTKQNHFMFDLPSFGMYQLKQLGLGTIIPSSWDTKADERFFSHRRASLEGKTTGRLLSAIIKHT